MEVGTSTLNLTCQERHTHSQVAVKIKHETLPTVTHTTHHSSLRGGKLQDMQTMEARTVRALLHCSFTEPQSQRGEARKGKAGGGLTLDPGCRVSVTRSESPPPAAAWRSSTTAEVTGSRRSSLCRREVEASEGLLFHETETETEAARGEEKCPCGRAAAEATAAATVDSSMVWSPLRGEEGTGE